MCPTAEGGPSPLFWVPYRSPPIVTSCSPEVGPRGGIHASSLRAPLPMPCRFWASGLVDPPRSILSPGVTCCSSSLLWLPSPSLWILSSSFSSLVSSCPGLVFFPRSLVSSLLQCRGCPVLWCSLPVSPRLALLFSSGVPAQAPLRLPPLGAGRHLPPTHAAPLPGRHSPFD